MPWLLDAVLCVALDLFVSYTRSSRCRLLFLLGWYNCNLFTVKESEIIIKTLTIWQIIMQYIYYRYFRRREGKGDNYKEERAASAWVLWLDVQWLMLNWKTNGTFKRLINNYTYCATLSRERYVIYMHGIWEIRSLFSFWRHDKGYFETVLLSND